MMKNNIKTLLISILSVMIIIASSFLISIKVEDQLWRSITFSAIGIVIYFAGITIYRKTNQTIDNLIEEEQEQYLDNMISMLYYIATSEDKIEEREAKLTMQLLYQVGLMVDATKLEKMFGISGGETRASQDSQNMTLKDVHLKEKLLDNFEERVNELFITMIDNAENDNRDTTILKDAHENSRTGILDTRKNIKDISEEDIVSIIESIYDGIRLIINDYFDQEILSVATEGE